jgi:hypothetical protein
MRRSVKLHQRLLRMKDIACRRFADRSWTESRFGTHWHERRSMFRRALIGEVSRVGAVSRSVVPE